MSLRIVLTGGGTGGHLLPLLTVAKKIKEKNPEVEFLFLGPAGKMEKELMAKEGISLKKITCGKMRRYFSWLNFSDFCKVPVGIVQSLWHLLVYLPDAIFSKGGYASLPVVLAGWAYRIPTMIHESDSVPGAANSLLGKFSRSIAVSYPQAESYFPPSQVVLTGNPLPEDINQGNAQKAREKFSLSEFKKVIFVLGGSQGSQIINRKILEILPELLPKYQVIHQTGELHIENIKKRAGELGIKIGRDGYYPIAQYANEDLKDILKVADLVISRSGANSLSEIAANEKPAIFIPLLDSANNHQKMNAYSLAKVGACVVLEENNLGQNIFLKNINELMENRELRQKLSQAIRAFYHPDAASRIAEEVLKITKT
ncbi:undecaprenyldiphospho-muramoylpentapeptide beta-N-acetylglucosaminyltransferase [Patescibacteria group bacterium]|nr:undecaprenyldiphospho-muramoylpentapeptide beta-N-acetylglucosaminyltransferase [Patescibacteria group bacterium]